MATTRREILLGGAALTSLVASNLVRVSEANAASDPARLQLRAGVRVGPCTVSRVLPVENGALPVELVDASGHPFVVEVHRWDEAAPPGIARAGSLAVYLRNGGTGETRTKEEHGLGALALAALLEARERAGKPVPRLASIVERWQHDPPPAR
jgi:hypothetical protein